MPTAPSQLPPGTPLAPPEAGSVDELVAPVALYPDPLLALVFPAATASSDVVLAARYLSSGGDPKQVDSQPWADSVRGLAHYPDVIKWMDENLAWTERLGEAYLNDPKEVMAAVQRDRARAQANGVLTNTPQQEVVADQGYIQIIPAQPDVIYVPRYDPDIIYIDQPVYYPSQPWITFGIGFGVGAWLAYDCDWRSHSIWFDAHRRDHWRDERDWRHPHFPDRPGVVREGGWQRWTPPPGRRPGFTHVNRPGQVVMHPAPIAGAPRFDRERMQRGAPGGGHAVSAGPANRFAPAGRPVEGGGRGPVPARNVHPTPAAQPHAVPPAAQRGREERPRDDGQHPALVSPSRPALRPPTTAVTSNTFRSARPPVVAPRTGSESPRRSPTVRGPAPGFAPNTGGQVSASAPARRFAPSAAPRFAPSAPTTTAVAPRPVARAYVPPATRAYVPAPARVAPVQSAPAAVASRPSTVSVPRQPAVQSRTVQTAPARSVPATRTERSEGNRDRPER